MKNSKGALDGIKVVELGQFIAGPFCGQLMGDMGADVIKVEAPGKGDGMRAWGNGDHKVWWEVIGRNKRSVTANLREERGQDLVRGLLKSADIMIENFKPGTIERWGLSPEQLHAINPGLIFVRISGYGQTGPYSSRAGFGGVAEAMSGLRAIVGEPDRPPSRVGISIGDTLAASYGCMGALAALHSRAKTGKGQVVDAALYESILQVMESLIPEYDVSGFVRQRYGSILPGIAPSNVYPCSDGDYMIGGNGDAIFARLASAMGRAELAEDPRYATHIARGKHQTELDNMIAEWTKTMTVDQLEALMEENSVPAGRIYRAADMLADPHFKAREAITSIDHPVHGKVHMQNCFPILSDTPSSVRKAAPIVPGEDNEAVYSEILNLSKPQIEQLAKEGII